MLVLQTETKDSEYLISFPYTSSSKGSPPTNGIIVTRGMLYISETAGSRLGLVQEHSATGFFGTPLEFANIHSSSWLQTISEVKWQACSWAFLTQYLLHLPRPCHPFSRVSQVTAL